VTTIKYTHPNQIPSEHTYTGGMTAKLAA